MGRDNRDLQKNKLKREAAVMEFQDQNKIIKDSREKNKVRKRKKEKYRKICRKGRQETGRQKIQKRRKRE